ncbi:MAG: c-type cytochrome [Candidimonas sp.]|nr:MAG: c-type cytochrome [Candidimonas sp.]
MLFSTKCRRALWYPLGISALSLLGAGLAQAESPADAGKLIFTQGAPGVTACITCHGAHGEGMTAANFPFLAGQGAAYLAAQIQMFSDGTRANPIMKPIAAALTPDQRQAVVAYIRTPPAPWDADKLAAQATTLPDAKDTGAWIANRGDWAHDIPACVQCHAAGGIGVAPSFPAIAGLSKTYIVEQFTQWRTGQRAGGPQNLMGDIAKRMNDGQIGAVASYFSALPQVASQEGAKKQ